MKLFERWLMLDLLLILALFSCPSSMNRLENKRIRLRNQQVLAPKTLSQAKQESMERKMYKNMENCNVNGKYVGNKPGAKHVRLRKIRDKIITKKTQAHLLKEKLIGEYIRRYRLKKRGYFIAVKSGNANDPEVWGGKCPSKTDHVHMGKYKIDWENTGKYNEPKSNFKFWCLLGLSLILSAYFMIPVPLFLGLVRTSVGSGYWDVPDTWDTGVPIPGTDTAVINGHTVTIATGTTVGAGTGAANTVAITLNDSVSSILTQQGNSTLQLYGYISKAGKSVCIHNADINGVCTIHIKSSLSTSYIWSQPDTVGMPTTNYSVYVSCIGTSALAPNIITSDGGLNIYGYVTSILNNGRILYSTFSYVSNTCPNKHTVMFTYGGSGHFRYDLSYMVFSVNPDYFFYKGASNADTLYVNLTNLTISCNTAFFYQGAVTSASGFCNDLISSSGAHSIISNCVLTNSHATISLFSFTLGMDSYGTYATPQTCDISNCTFTNTLNGGIINDVSIDSPTLSSGRCDIGNINYTACTFTNGAGAITKIRTQTRSTMKHTFYSCSLTKTDVTFTAGGTNNGVGYVLLKSKLAPTIVDTASAPIQDVWIAAITGAQDGTTLTPYDTCDDFTLNTGLTNPIYLGFAKAPNSTGVWVDWCAVGTEAYITFDKSPYNQYSLDNATWVNIGTPLRNSMLSNYTSTIYLRYSAGSVQSMFMPSMFKCS